MNSATFIHITGGQNVLLEAVVEDLCQRLTPGGCPRYIRNADDKRALSERDVFASLNLNVDDQGKMMDLVIYRRDRNRIVLF